MYNRDGALPCSSMAHMESEERGCAWRTNEGPAVVD